MGEKLSGIRPSIPCQHRWRQAHRAHAGHLRPGQEDAVGQEPASPKGGARSEARERSCCRRPPSRCRCWSSVQRCTARVAAASRSCSPSRARKRPAPWACSGTGGGRAAGLAEASEDGGGTSRLDHDACSSVGVDGPAATAARYHLGRTELRGDERRLAPGDGGFEDAHAKGGSVSTQK